MGHQRLGTIPTSLKWDSVLELLFRESATLATSDSSAGIAALSSALAAETLNAAAPALLAAYADEAVRYTFYLLTQIVLAARHDDWRERFAVHDIQLTEKSSVFDLTSQLAYAVDDHLLVSGRPTNVSEMAQDAAGEALTNLANSRTLSLFDSGGSEIKEALRAMSTEKGFSQLGQVFFGRFTSRFLNFYLSRATAGSIGRGALSSVGEVAAFDEALRTHCEESARIVRDFCGAWYSKTEFE